MKMGERTINNALFNAGSSIVPLILSLIFWPYIVSSLGESSYGIYALTGSIIGYFSLLDLGLGNAVIKYVAEYTGKQHEDKAREVIGTALFIFMAAGMAGLILIIAISNMLTTKLLQIPPELVYVAYYSFLITGIGFFFTTQLNFFTSITNGLNRYDISSSMFAFMGVLTTGSAVLLLYMGFGLIALVCMNVIITCLAVLSYCVLSRYLLPSIRIQLMVKLKVLKRLLHFGVYSLLSRITDVVMCQVGPLLIGAILGLAPITYYVVPFTILNRLTGLIIRLGTVTFPTISELHGKQQYDTIRELYLTSSRVILSFSTAATVSLLIFGTRFLHLWMTPEFADKSGTVLTLITIGFFIDHCTNIPTSVANGLGKPKISAVAAISRAILFLGLMIAGAKYYGIIGVAIAFTLSDIIVAPAFTAYVCRKVLGISLLHLLKEVYMRPLLAAVTVSIPLMLIPQKRINNLFLLLVIMATGTIVYFIVALCFGVYQPKERQILSEYLTNAAARLHRGRRFKK